MRIKQPFDKNNIFFTADGHFGHFNIIKFCDRPYKDVNDMDKTLIANWNKVVPKDGIVFILGDLFFKTSISYTEGILEQLNGKLYLILGNHDNPNLFRKQRIKKFFVNICDTLEIIVLDEDLWEKKQRLSLNHFPLLTWNGFSYGTWNLFGHIHSKRENRWDKLHKNQYDVGVDNNFYKPCIWEDIKIQIIRQNLADL